EGQLPQARQLLEQAVKHQQAALRTNPRHPTYRKFLCNHYMTLAVALFQLGEHAEATLAAERRAALVFEDPSSVWRSYVVLRRCMSLAEKDARLSKLQRQAALTDYAERARQVLRAAAAQQSSGKLPAVLNLWAWSMVASKEPLVHDIGLAVEFAQKAVAA